jgi:hypothetical protein
MSTLLSTFVCSNLAEARRPFRQPASFNGVSAMIVLQNSVVRTGEPLKVEFSLRNASSRPVTFRFMPLAEDAEVYFRSGAKVPFADRAVFADGPFYEVTLKPGQIVRRQEELGLAAWYDLVPGKYQIRFYYNL